MPAPPLPRLDVEDDPRLWYAPYVAALMCFFGAPAAMSGWIESEYTSAGVVAAAVLMALLEAVARALESWLHPAAKPRRVFLAFGMAAVLVVANVMAALRWSELQQTPLRAVGLLIGTAIAALAARAAAGHALPSVALPSRPSARVLVLVLLTCEVSFIGAAFASMSASHAEALTALLLFGVSSSVTVLQLAGHRKTAALVTASGSAKPVPLTPGPVPVWIARTWTLGLGGATWVVARDAGAPPGLLYAVIAVTVLTAAAVSWIGRTRSMSLVFHERHLLVRRRLWSYAIPWEAITAIKDASTDLDQHVLITLTSLESVITSRHRDQRRFEEMASFNRLYYGADIALDPSQFGLPMKALLDSLAARCPEGV